MISNTGDEEPSIILIPKNLNQVVAGANIWEFIIPQTADLTGPRKFDTSSWGVWETLYICGYRKFYYFHL
jgi:hypothetical protein